MKIAILTNFMEFNTGYSLTGIVKDQVEMFTRYGHEVHLFVNDQYHGEEFPGNVILEKKIPFSHLKDYMSAKDISPEHHEIINKTSVMLSNELQDYDFALTHDFVFTGWFLPYGEACRRATPNLPNVKWLHWIHSVPSGNRDYWDIKIHGPNHKLVFPNSADRIKVAEEFKGWSRDVRIIPHIKDLRSFWDFGQVSREFIDRYEGIMQNDVVQLLPASVDRLDAKRTREVMAIFSHIKRLGKSVFLLIANQWATERKQREDVDRYREFAKMKGLIDQVDFAFTSDFETEPGVFPYNVGIPKDAIRELFLCSNLFIFPTREESFGLVVPEAALCGCLSVLNRSLPNAAEVGGGGQSALYFEFGSWAHQFNNENPDRYFGDLAKIILGRMNDSEVVNSKTFARQNYNMDRLYHEYYIPIMYELKGQPA